MGGACIAVDTAVLAAPVGVDAGVEAHVRAVVVADDRAGRVGVEVGGRSHLIFVGEAMVFRTGA